MERSKEQASLLDELINGRRSIRKYKSDIPPVKWIEKMLQSATMAPSPSNSQPVRFIRIRSRSKNEDILRAMASGRQAFLEALKARGGSKRLKNRINAYYRFSEFLSKAPLLFAVGTITSVIGFSRMLTNGGILTQYDKDESSIDISVGLALKGFILKGEELGLGSCILTAPLIFIPNIEEILKIEDISIKCLLTVGFPDEEPAFLNKKGVAAIYSEV